MSVRWIMSDDNDNPLEDFTPYVTQTNHLFAKWQIENFSRMSLGKIAAACGIGLLTPACL